MTVTANWIVSNMSGPPSHPVLRTKYEDARQTGAPVHVFLAAPPPVGGGLQRCQRNTQLIHPRGTHTDPPRADQASARASFAPFLSAVRLRVARVR